MMLEENEFNKYHLISYLNIIVKDKIVASLFNIDQYCLSEFKAIRKYKDLLWDLQGAINQSFTNDDTDIFCEIKLTGLTGDQEEIIRYQKLGSS